LIRSGPARPVLVTGGDGLPGLPYFRPRVLMKVVEKGENAGSDVKYISIK
jgi:hypothetical protein